MSPDDSTSAGGTVPPSQAIIEGIAEREGVDVTDIEPPAYDPLYSVIDPAALDALFQTSSSAEYARVVLEYEGYDVVVHSDGRVEIRDQSNGDSDTSINHSVEERG